MKIKIIYFLNYFSHTQAATTGKWLGPLAYANTRYATIRRRISQSTGPIRNKTVVERRVFCGSKLRQLVPMDRLISG